MHPVIFIVALAVWAVLILVALACARAAAEGDRILDPSLDMASPTPSRRLRPAGSPDCRSRRDGSSNRWEWEETWLWVPWRTASWKP